MYKRHTFQQLEKNKMLCNYSIVQVCMFFLRFSILIAFYSLQTFYILSMNLVKVWYKQNVQCNFYSDEITSSFFSVNNIRPIFSLCRLQKKFILINLFSFINAIHILWYMYKW